MLSSLSSSLVLLTIPPIIRFTSQSCSTSATLSEDISQRTPHHTTPHHTTPPTPPHRPHTTPHTQQQHTLTQQQQHTPHHTTPHHTTPHHSTPQHATTRHNTPTQSLLPFTRACLEILTTLTFRTPQENHIVSVPFETIEKKQKICFSIFLVSPGHLGTIQNLIPGWTTIVKLLKQVKNWQSPSRDPWSNCLINSREDDKRSN